MVVLNVKRNGSSLFLYQTNLTSTASEATQTCVHIHNGQLKIDRMAEHLKDLARHGVALPTNARGLLEEQLKELKIDVGKELEDYEPSGGHITAKDELGRRCGRAPKEEMSAVLTKTADEAKAIVSKDKVTANQPLTMTDVKKAMDVMKGAVMIVYPMGLPEHDPFQLEADNAEEDVPKALQPLDPAETRLWFANKELSLTDPLSKAMGSNEKTKVVVKLSTVKEGRPVTESWVSEAEELRMREESWKRMEELRRMAKDEDDSYLDSKWADGGALKKKFNGLDNISWK